ncbi:ABC transporter permease [Paucibacter sp. APW11]|uniref:ABC transporter permease n=1 Tax=Roseateles aquae TaxID=3077235 RepID=A0ABU3PA18_9BURK|nr:FtsX-like permease family protein [Paucibacter sp. APW11]MDT8999373.1 ABC transporter permease [Paucibacter sp. APW11]
MSHSAPATASPAQPSRLPHVMQLAWRQLWRDWRAGEMRLLGLAVMLAVAAVCAVGFLSDRMQLGLQRDAAQLIGGDALVASDKPTPAGIVALADGLGLAQMRSISFPSMARAPEAQGGATRLVSVKAVSASYPLRGRLQLGDGRLVGAPAPGTVWVDAEVLQALALRLGDEVLLGESQLRIAGVIRTEPDRGASFMSFAPRLMLAETDLAATGLIQPGSRVTYRLAVAAEAGGSAAARFIEQVKQLVERDEVRGVRLESLENGRPEMRQTLDRAARFLKLVAMLAALLAAVAVSLAARDFAARHLDACAMLRVLGQSQARIAWTFGLAFGAAGLLASLAGVALGFGLHFVFLRLLAGLLAVDLPPPSVWPAVGGLALGLSLLMGFGMAPVLQLAAVPALRVMRRDLGAVRMGSTLVLGGGLLGFAGILVAISGEWRLGLITALGFGAALLLFALLAWLAVKLLRLAVPQAGAPRWLMLATRQVAARPGFVVVQVASLAVGLLALSLLVMLRTDLISSWRAATPKDAPDRFVINIQPEQGEAFQARLRQLGVQRYDWYPMIRGRLIALNGQPLRAQQQGEERSRALLEREFNLSHAAQLPAHNQVIAGQWVDEEADGLSVEQGLAQQLGIKLGDRLRFDVAGTQIEARVSSLRKVDWASMRVNFFVMFPRRSMPELPKSYISAFHAPGAAFDAELAREFPNITSVNVTAQLLQLQTVLDQVAQAVQFLFTFTLAVGLLVLLAAVGSSREARTREFALMRALGASSGLLAQVQRAELLGVGALAGFLAGLAALALGAALARYVFDFSWELKLWVPLGAMLAGALLAQLAGWWGLRGVLQRPVMSSLREAESQ